MKLWFIGAVCAAISYVGVSAMLTACDDSEEVVETPTEEPGEGADDIVVAAEADVVEAPEADVVTPLDRPDVVSTADAALEVDAVLRADVPDELEPDARNPPNIPGPNF